MAILWRVVKKADKRDVPAVARQASLVVQSLMSEKGVTQTRVARALDRNQGYVSERCRGIDTFSLAELEVMAPLLGFKDLFDLLDEVSRRRDQS